MRDHRLGRRRARPPGDRLTPWNRITIDLLRARCRGEMPDGIAPSRERHMAYPRSILAQATTRGRAPVLEPAESRAGDSAICQGMAMFMSSLTDVLLR